MPRNVTLQTIAEAVGVSRTTVSNAYSRPDQLNPGLRERILSTAHQLGYSGPDAAARTLRRGRTGALGLLFTETLSYAFADPFAVGFLRGLAEAVERSATGLLLIPLAPGQTGEEPVRDALVDGFYVYCLPDGHPALAAVGARGLPVVSGAPIPDMQAGFVGIDERAGGSSVAEHLLALGHRRIAVVVDVLGEDDTPGPVSLPEVEASPMWDVRQRVVAVADTLDDAEVGAKSLQIVLASRNSREYGAAAAGRLLDTAQRPTAVLTTSDVLALGVLDAARARGIDVPSQLSVAGFDDIDQARDVGLTTVRQPMTKRGQLSGEVLLDAVNAGVPAGDVCHVLPTELVVRASTGPAPG